VDGGKLKEEKGEGLISPRKPPDATMPKYRLSGTSFTPCWHQRREKSLRKEKRVAENGRKTPHPTRGKLDRCAHKLSAAVGLFKEHGKGTGEGRIGDYRRGKGRALFQPLNGAGADKTGETDLGPNAGGALHGHAERWEDRTKGKTQQYQSALCCSEPRTGGKKIREQEQASAEKELG